jgi:hypothetical protein
VPALKPLHAGKRDGLSGSHIPPSVLQMFLIYISKLPHPKDVILNALLSEIRKDGHPKRVTDALCGLAMCLSQFQRGVGEKPLEALGIDLSKFPDRRDMDAIASAINDASDAQERFKRFTALVELDEKQIDAALALAKTDTRQKR